MNRPKVNPNPDLSEVIKTIEAYFDFLDGDYHEDRIGDWENYIVEDTLKALYGKNVYEWINRFIV
jgi:hypothetical protein